MKRLAWICLLAACGDEAAKEAPSEAPNVDAVAIGACGGLVDDDYRVRGFALAPCTEPHASEVIGRYTLSDAARPAYADLRLSSYQACMPLFEAYVGRSVWFSDLDIETVVPSSASWAGGDRSVTCLAVHGDRVPIDEPARGSRL